MSDSGRSYADFLPNGQRVRKPYRLRVSASLVKTPFKA